MSFIVKQQFKGNNEVLLSVLFCIIEKKPYYEYKDTHLFNNITTIELFFMYFMAINTLKQFEHIKMC